MTRLILLLAVVLAAQPAFAQSDDWSDGWSRHRRDEGVHLRILRDYHLPAGSTVYDPIVVIGGSAIIDGRVENEVVVIGGTLQVGPQAVIRGDLVTVGSTAMVDPAAEVSGEIARTVVVWPDLSLEWPRLGHEWWAAAAFATMLVRLTFVLLVSVFLTLVAPRWVGAISTRVGESTAVSGIVGLAGELLFAPAVAVIVVALLISIIGIPLLGAVPFLVAAGALVWTAGFAGVAARLGARLRGGDSASSHSPVLDVLVGFATLTAVTVAAHIMALGPGWMGRFAFATGAMGLVIEYIAWTVGLGAAIGSLISQQRSTPPPVPMPLPTPI